MSRTTLRASFEAIDFQRNSLLFKELTIACSELKTINRRDGSQVQSILTKMNNVILKHTGISVNLKYDEFEGPDIAVIPPKLDKNHPLLTNFYRNHTNNEDALRLLKHRGGMFKGAVDRSNSTVSGIFSELTSVIYFTEGMVESHGRVELTPSELAAVILHECGHIFVYFEYLGTGITTNYVLQQVSRQLMSTAEVKHKYKILDDAADILNIKIEDPLALINATNDTVVQIILLKAQQNAIRQSELGSTSYDNTASEMLADQFVTRHGGGRDLVTAMIKLDKVFEVVGEYSGRATWISLEVAKFLSVGLMTTGFGSLIPLLISAMVILLSNSDNGDYDKPKDRFLRIERDIISTLKNRNLDKDLKRSLLEDLQIIKEITDGMNKFKTTVHYLNLLIRRDRKKQYSQIVFQQELEMLASNALFAKAAEIDVLHS